MSWVAYMCVCVTVCVCGWLCAWERGSAANDTNIIKQSTATRCRWHLSQEKNSKEIRRLKSKKSTAQLCRAIERTREWTWVSEGASECASQSESESESTRESANWAPRTAGVAFLCERDDNTVKARHRCRLLLQCLLVGVSNCNWLCDCDCELPSPKPLPVLVGEAFYMAGSQIGVESPGSFFYIVYLFI